MVKYLENIDTTTLEFGELYDELPLWSAPFGMMMLDRIPMRRGMTIVDVGCGTGFLTVELAQRCGRDSKVIAVDPSHALMARLRRKLDYIGITNAELVTKDAADIDLPDNSVDLIVSNLGVNNFSNADAVLRMCYRVLKPGGTIALTSNLVGHMREFYDAFREILADAGLNEERCALDAHIDHRATLESVSAMLARAGFEIPDATESSFTMRFADGSSMLQHHFIRLGFLPAWRDVAASNSALIFERLAQKLDQMAANSGELSLFVPIAYFESKKPPPNGERT